MIPAGFERLQEKLYRLALSITRNEKDAEDVLQNAGIKILRRLPQFRNRSQLSTWAYRIAYNEALLFLRKKRRLSNTASAYQRYTGLGVNWQKLPDAELLEKELRQRLDAAVASLDLAYRMPLLLHRMEGLSLAECARILRVRESTVKTRLHRAYLALKTELDAYYRDLPEPQQKQEQGCGIWTGFLSAYIRDTVPAGKKAAFNRHIKDCPGCKDFLKTYLQALRITAALQCRDIPAALKAKLRTFPLRRK